MPNELSLGLLKKLIRVDIEKGKVYWLLPPKYHNDLLGKEAGCKNCGKTGKFYWNIQICGKRIKRSRIIFLFKNLKWPSEFIDHIDGNSLNDEICNLRQANSYQNAWNHKHRKKKSNCPMGVRFVRGKYQARISYMHKQIHIGCFKTEKEAELAYQTKRKELFNEYA